MPGWRDDAILIEDLDSPDGSGSDWRAGAIPLPNTAAKLAAAPHANIPKEFVDYLAPDGIPLELLDVGVNSSNAAQWADLHMKRAARENGGQPVPFERRTAIFDLYKQLGGREDISSRNFTREHTERMLTDRRSTLRGRFADAGAAYNRGMASLGTSLLGTVMPETAAGLQRNVEATFATDPDSRAGFAGGLAAEAVKLGSIGAAGAAVGGAGATMAGVYGAQGFGGTRIRAEELRRSGKDVSIGAELGTAAGIGAVEAASGAVGAKIFGALGSQLKQLGPAIARAFGTGGQAAGARAVRQAVGSALTAGGLALAEGAEEGITQLITNKITQLGMDPDQALMEGVGEAALTGLILSPIGAGAVGPRGRVAATEGAAAPLADSILAEPAGPQDPLPPSRQLPPAPARFTADAEGNVRDRYGPPPPAVPTGSERFAAREAQRSAPAAEPAPKPAPARPERNVVAPLAEQEGMILTDRAAAEQLVAQARENRLNDPEVQTLIARGTDPDEAIRIVYDTVPEVVPGTGVLAGTYTARFSPPQPGTDRRRPSRSMKMQEVPDADLDPDVRTLRDQVKKAVGPGVKVHIVHEAGGASGFYSPRTKTMYVAKGRSKTGLVNTLVHEAMHATDLDTDSLIGTPRMLRQAENEYMRAFNAFADKNPQFPDIQAMRKELQTNPATRRREAVAILAGRLAEDRTFARQLVNRSPSFVQKVMDTVRRAINTLTGKQKHIDTLAREFLDRIAKNTGLSGSEPGTAGFGATIRPEGRRAASPGKDFSEQAYPYTQRVRVTFDDGTSIRDQVKGLNQGHAMARARDNWPGAKIEPIGRAMAARRPMLKPGESQTVQEQADQYSRRVGLPPVRRGEYAKVDEARAKQIAAAYENLKHDPADPQVKQAYDDMKSETLDQYEFLRAQGVTFEPWPHTDSQPYADSKAMMKDVRENQHLWFFTGGDMPADHPLGEKIPGDSGLTYNNVFRAVHDYFGHAKEGYGFGPRGEENAWRVHSQMYTPSARQAMTTETRGQNSWVNFGPHGESNRADPANNVYAEQKAAILPAEYHQLDSEAPSAAERQFMPPPLRKPGVTATKGRFTVPQGIEDFITPISTRLSNISGKIYRRLIQFEMRSRVQREDLQRAVSGFLRDKNQKLSKAQQAQFDLHVFNGDFQQAKQVLQAADPTLLTGFADVVSVLNSVYAAAKRAGIDTGFTENYWPREVKDYAKWREQIRGDEPGPVRDAIALQESRLGRKLTPEEEIDVANHVLQGYGPRKPGETRPKSFRSRSQATLTPDMLPLYQNADQALMGYLNRAVHAIEKARFFGKGTVGADILDSIGRWTAELVASGEITAEQEREVKDLLASRFTTGETSPSGMVRSFRDFGYLTVLANPISTITQIGDLFLSAYRNGMINTVRALPGKKRLKMESLGIERIAAEFSDPSRLAKVLDWGMRLSGFTWMDRLGKETFLNSAMRRYVRAAKSPKSAAYRALEAQYRPIFGADFDAMVADFAANTVTENVRLLLFMELSGVQPISLSEMPKKYLDSPNGRLFYMLKTFTVKQLDLIRRNAFAKMNRGDVAGGASDLLRFTLILGLGNALADLLKDWILGRDVKWTDMAIDGVLRLFGGSKFLADSSIREGPGRAFFSMILPPTGAVDDLSRDALNVPDIWAGERGVNSVRNVPGIGKILHWRLGEGARKTEAARRTELRKREAEIRQLAIDALAAKDRTGAKAIVEKWNVEEKPGWMENMTLRSVANSRRSRRVASFTGARTDAAEALLSGDRKEATRIIEEHNAQSPERPLTMKHAEGQARRLRARGRTE